MKKCPFFKSDCLKDKCELWTKAEVRDEQPGILRFEEGCAIRLLARKGGGGYISIEKLMRDENGNWVD